MQIYHRFIALLLALSMILVGQTLLASTGQLVLTVVDRETGKPIPCRMHLIGPKKKPFKPDFGTIILWCRARSS